MNIFVINTGSSSLKYQLFKMPDEQPVCTGLIERIGTDNSGITHKTYINGEESVIKEKVRLNDHEAGLYEVTRLLTDKKIGVISSLNDIEVVGHRAVHGGETFSATTFITDEVMDKIKELFSLAPLHNPANYIGIQVAQKVFPAAKQVAVFDTAFHQTMPPKAFRFAIPQSYYTKHHIRAYGFHGTSHKYVAAKAAEYLNKKDAKIITIHLGNGSSMAAIDKGHSVDTTMGLGPVGGLIMGTRSGDIDPSVIFHLLEQLNYTPAEVIELLNKKSGMIGLTGHSDMRDIHKLANDGDKNAELAFELYAYRIKKYIGAYAAVLNGLDAIVFTAGVGENDTDIRKRVCTDMQYLGIHFDEAKNIAPEKGTREINTADSPVKVLVVPTNEELEIVKQCYELVNKGA
ncbi:MAG TPA: acetate kinase [Chitinophagaceae bacterium]|jgi:acetate kinase|nr:acetate kinase [Chitinophagaceae bacterium]HMU59324.1 acetate kinase [Chitinophagaceae bacterium]